MLAQIEAINSAVNGVVWGPIMLVLLVGTGIYLTFRTRGLQARRFGFILRNTIGTLFSKDKKKSGSQHNLTPFQAVSTALAGTVGTGNIAGVTGAIFVGGPGAVFWMWVSAFFGMITKYAEIVLSVKYRQVDEKGAHYGGPMYYIEKGAGQKWLAILFALLGGIACFGIGNIAQSTEIAGAVQSLTGLDPLYTGIILAILTAIVVIGGVKRIGQVASYLVPFMAMFYIVAGLAIIVLRITDVPAALASIFTQAFSLEPREIGGGVAGYTIMISMQQGVARGVFSNEAGLGSAPMAHAATSETDPVKQGLYGIFEVFMDTIVICSLSGLTILCAAEGGALNLNIGTEGTTALNAQALGSVFTQKGGAIIIAVGLALFAFSTILSWALYGTRCCEFLFGSKAIKPYQIIFLVIIFVGATMELSLAWSIADTLNGLMAIPNLIALVGLSGVVVRETKRHFSEKVNK